ncbi:MAG: hypothetical protein IK076_04370 [Bacteroidales bacterium]|nr:hypothetical protein [Bacteroidales bacterium]
MKNTIKLSFLAAALLALASLVSCSRELVDTDQLGGSIALAALSPNPVVRGSELHIYGVGLGNVKEVRIPGIAPITSFTKGTGKDRLEEIIVAVPVEGPEVGKVVIADAQGNTSSSKFDLTYIEGMVFEDFSCADEVMPGDVITLTGEYLNTIQEVIFTSGNDVTYATGAMIFDKERHSAKVYVPASATSGIIKICDVDEAADPNAIPNIYPSVKEIKVGKPTVDVSEFPDPVKAGTVLTFTGSYLNMIAKVEFAGEEQKEFTVSDDASELSAALPAKAADGEVVFTTYAGDKFVAGTVKGVLPSELTIEPDKSSGDPRYKAGYNVIILGDDLNLVTGVSFGGVSASFSYKAESVPDSLVAVIPADAPDGDVVVSLANGSSAMVGSIGIVNPTVDKISKTEIVAREDFVLEGKDLELISKLTVGGVECKIALDTLDVIDGVDEEGDPIKIAVLDSNKVIVTTAPTILSGDVVIEKLNGWNKVISHMEVSYDEAVSLVVPEGVALGKAFEVSGTNLFMVEQIFIKGKKVVDWNAHSDNAMSFQIPEGIGPGVYRLDLVLNDGQELTWPIPFEVSASYTETFVWQGNHDLAGWGANLEAGPEDGFVQAGIKVGDVVRVYYSTYNDWWQFKLQDGHWGSINLEQYDNDCLVTTNNANSGDTYLAFEVTQKVYDQLSLTGQGWGYSFVINGEGAIIKGISLIQFGETEKVLFEGPVSMTWDDSGRFGLAMSFFDDAVADSKLIIYFQQTENWGQVQFNDGWWGNGDIFFPEISGAHLTTDNVGGKDVTKFELTLTQAVLDIIRSRPGDYFGLNSEYQGDGRVGMVIQGADWIIEKITIL